MNLPNYNLVGDPERFVVRGKKSRNYSQRYRVEGQKRKQVSLKTHDKQIARRRAIEYVEKAIRDALVSGPNVIYSKLSDLIDAHCDDLIVQGNTEAHAEKKRRRLTRIVEVGKFQKFSDINPQKARAAIVSLKVEDQDKTRGIKTTNTLNKFVQEAKSFSRWMYLEGKWPVDSLGAMQAIKGDTSTSRPRTILADQELRKLLKSVIEVGKDRRHLSPEQRRMLYLFSSQTALRASECRSLTPNSFHLDLDEPHVVVACTISKRRTRDEVMLSPQFTEILREWLVDFEPDEPIWPGSWTHYAAETIYKDLEAAGIPKSVQTKEGEAYRDFHALRAYRITELVRSNAPMSVIKKLARLSSEALVEVYTKLAKKDLSKVVNSIKLPV